MCMLAGSTASPSAPSFPSPPNTYSAAGVHARLECLLAGGTVSVDGVKDRHWRLCPREGPTTALAISKTANTRAISSNRYFRSFFESFLFVSEHFHCLSPFLNSTTQPHPAPPGSPIKGKAPKINGRSRNIKMMCTRASK